MGNLLNWISRGRGSGNTLVSEVMFDFSHVSEVVTDSKGFGLQKLESNVSRGGYVDKTRGRRNFIEITMDTHLSALGKFFERNSAAIVTDKRSGGEGGLTKPVAIVTKVDLLTWLVKQAKV